ncbi:MAG: hypothetical protein V4471_00715 [Pseudomonadota bacterium]
MENNNQDENKLIKVEEGTNFTIDLDETSIEKILEKDKTAKLVGAFSPNALGKKKLTAIFNYKEGDVVEVSSETEVIQVKLNIELVKPVDFSKNFPLNFEEEVEFLIKNETGLDATEIQIKTNLLENVTVEEGKPDGSEGYNWESPIDLDIFEKNNSSKLDPSHRFRVKGKLKTDETGEKKLTILVKYRELESLAEDDLEKQGAKFEENINIESVPIEGLLKKTLPDKTKLGNSYNVIFNFINKSKQFPATDVRIEIMQGEEGT